VDIHAKGGGMMGRKTGIQWCDDTVNPSSGCDGCELWKLLRRQTDMAAAIQGGSCYAGHLQVNRLSKAMPELYSADFMEVRMIPGRMKKAASGRDLTGTDRPEKPWLNGMPRIIFVGDMGDIFSEAITFEFLKAELIDNATSKQGRRHIWMVLTKRPRRMNEFAEWLEFHGIEWPENIWVGTSITHKASLTRLDYLIESTAKFKFISAEPLREAVDLSPWFPGVDLCIIGGESTQGEFEAIPFDLQWARDLIEQCRRAEVAALVKQLGSRPYFIGRKQRHDWPLVDSHGGDWGEWPADLRVREFPVVAEAVR
jgi:protein gp37